MQTSPNQTKSDQPAPQANEAPLLQVKENTEKQTTQAQTPNVDDKYQEKEFAFDDAQNKDMKTPDNQGSNFFQEVYQVNGEEIDYEKLKEMFSSLEQFDEL